MAGWSIWRAVDAEGEVLDVLVQTSSLLKNPEI
jgi:transposase-like protein